MLADTSIETQLREKLSKTRRALRNLVNSNNAFAEMVCMYSIDSKEALRAADKLEQRLIEAERLLRF